MSRAYYSDYFTDFLRREPEYILGSLAANHQFVLEDHQKNAWISQIEILRSALPHIEQGYILFEYSIPRMGKRVDVVLLVQGAVAVLEFKVGDNLYSAQAINQSLDYALDLKNFHEQSRDRPIIPIVVATEACETENQLQTYDDLVFHPLKANRHNLGLILQEALNSVVAHDIDPLDWRDSNYKPTPTIIEAAQALYRGHSVQDISRSDAGAINLSLTTEAISTIIDNSKNARRKSICFVTGVPGAGKTLAGLNIAHERLRIDEGEHAVFLSGNGPLVKVLREALVRDEILSDVSVGKTGRTRRSASSKVQTFIQNIHHFRDDALNHVDRVPLEKVVIFDEAQRAWTLEQTASFMKRKRHVRDFSMSEPQFLISVMDRHPDWAVIVCLVGGGQEINTGEAGLPEWFRALQTNYPHWHVHLSPNLTDDEYLRGQDFSDSKHFNFDPRLHLAVSLRSFRAESVSSLVKAVLDNHLEQAAVLQNRIKRHYPITITRDINKAREWLRSKSRGSERYGILASSGAMRLRPIGINVQADIDVENWFLNDQKDIRSSYFLEEVGTEFHVQGLELDWTCVVWDADYRHTNGSWECKAFRGTKWLRAF